MANKLIVEIATKIKLNPRDTSKSKGLQYFVNIHNTPIDPIKFLR